MSEPDIVVPGFGSLRDLLARHPRPRPDRQRPESPPARPRLTVLETVYHQAPGDEPTVFQAPFGCALASDESPCVRPKVSVGEDWQPLDGLWLSAASQLVLRNEEGKFSGGRPTPEQVKDVTARVVEVGVVCGDVVVPFSEIPPGESQRYRPLDLAALCVRCRQGKALITVAAFPQ